MGELLAAVSARGAQRRLRRPGDAAERFVRVHLELGGNASVIVLPTPDPEAAALAIAEAAFYNAGQDRIAASRVLVEASALSAFAELHVAVAL
jgi:betaine-aldehyde dehydrogenase